MKVIGITGGVGAGKSEILNYLHEKYGATICKADEVARKLERKGTPCFDAIVAHFGTGILNEKGELNRDRLSEIVFTNSEELSVLNQIVHPAVKEEVRKQIAKEQRRNTNLFILEAAVLIEDHYEEICDELWYIYVDDSVRKARLHYSRGYNERKIDDIFASQLSKEAYMEHSDRVIDNSVSFEETTQQLDEIIKDL